MAIDTDIQHAVSAIRKQQFEEAVALLSRVLGRRPDDLRARWLLVQSHESLQQVDSALEQLRILLIHVKKDLPAIDQIATHMRERRYPLNHALQTYRKYLVRQPDSAVAEFNYAYNLSKDGQFEAAIEQYARSLEHGIDTPEEVHLNIANIYMDHLHAHDKAEVHLQDALALNPGYASAFYNLGNLSEQVGDREAARRYFEKCLQADPGNDAALARLADTQTFDLQDDPLLIQLQAMAGSSNNPDVHMALGKAEEQLGNFDKAWQQFSKANQFDERLMPAYDPQTTETDFRDIAAGCNQEWLKQHEGLPGAPVFICGMFRSGSTLLEQVLASHPSFIAGGESEFFPRLIAREFPHYPQGLGTVTIEALRGWQQQHHDQSRKLFGDALRPTDKRPDNFLYIGLIKAILPNAKILVTERDWRDIATSIYSVRLGSTQPYATNLENIRHYIGLQAGLIDYWEEQLGPDLMRVRYEDLVLKPKETVSSLLGWLGETWDDRCLSFHELKNSVRTASVWQVREPLHSKSIGRWENYRQQFIDALGSDPKS